jgi:hypothetical protein
MSPGNARVHQAGIFRIAMPARNPPGDYLRVLRRQAYELALEEIVLERIHGCLPFTAKELFPGFLFIFPVFLR